VLASNYLLPNHAFLKVGTPKIANTITQIIRYSPDTEKRKNLLKELKKDESMTLVFAKTKNGAEALSIFLNNNQFTTTAIHGNKSQIERETALNNFRSGKIQILIATDVAARGIDVPNIKHVINFDLPSKIEDYIHRIGRTGRAGKTGIATSFYTNTTNKEFGVKLISLLEQSNQAVPKFLKIAQTGNLDVLKK